MPSLTSNSSLSTGQYVVSLESFPRAYRYSSPADLPHAIAKGHQQGQLQTNPRVQPFELLHGQCVDWPVNLSLRQGLEAPSGFPSKRPGLPDPLMGGVKPTNLAKVGLTLSDS
ncbi:hypothetical protein N7444_001973 [Penicillium canescens]|nr:hypothetical protein N7444_001973 [Penicillium canescens]